MFRPSGTLSVFRAFSIPQHSRRFWRETLALLMLYKFRKVWQKSTRAQEPFPGLVSSPAESGALLAASSFGRGLERQIAAGSEIDRTLRMHGLRPVHRHSVRFKDLTNNFYIILLLMRGMFGTPLPLPHYRPSIGDAMHILM